MAHVSGKAGGVALVAIATVPRTERKRSSDLDEKKRYREDVTKAVHWHGASTGYSQGPCAPVLSPAVVVRA